MKGCSIDEGENRDRGEPPVEGGERVVFLGRKKAKAGRASISALAACLPGPGWMGALLHRTH